MNRILNTPIKIISYLFILSIFFITPVMGISKEIIFTDDTYADGYSPAHDTIRGALSTMFTKSLASNDAIIFFSVDLSTITNYTDIVNISLYSSGSPSGGQIWELYSTSSFSEGSLTWHNMPALGDLLLSSTETFPTNARFNLSGSILTDYINDNKGSMVYFAWVNNNLSQVSAKSITVYATEQSGTTNDPRLVYNDTGYILPDEYNDTNNIIFSNTTDYTQNITTHPINTLLYVTTFLNNSNWNFWTDAFANLRVLNPDGVQVEDWSIYQQNASQFSFTPVLDGVYTAQIYCGVLCYPFTGETEFIFSSNTVTVEYPYNSPDDLLFSHTLDYSTSITEHPLNESFYLNVWIEEGSSMRESDYFGHWRINVTSPDDLYLGTYYPVRSYYQGSYPIQISMNQFSGTGKFGNYTFKMFFALTPDDINNGEILIKESVIYLYNSSNYNDTGYYNNISEELGNVPDVDISNYTDVPELQFLNNSFSYDTFVWIATPIHSMHTGIDSINNYYSDTNNTQHITVLGSIVPILISELPEKVKLLFTYQIILTVILLIMGRD